jgi:hypothetical protein
LFGLGLLVSGMTDPAKVLGFLDVTSGVWDPSLALVMAGAIGVHAVGLRLVRRARPVWAERFAAPPPRTVDGRLLAGAAIFGVGWGLGGVCPGPAFVAGAAASSSSALFVVGLLLGLWASARAAPAAPVTSGVPASTAPSSA